MSNNWNGEGLPKVGEMVCVSGIDDDKDENHRFNNKEVVVMANFYLGDSYCIAISHASLGISAIIFDKSWVKPIKSDRDKAIEEMRNVFEYNIGSQDYIFGVLYDAGYRKTTSGE